MPAFPPPADAALLAESRAALAAATECVLTASDGAPFAGPAVRAGGGRAGDGPVAARCPQSFRLVRVERIAARPPPAGGVLAADRRGSGRNGADHGDARHADRLLADVRQLAAVARRLSHGSPLVLGGG